MPKRRLVAIMFTDIEGYTALMQRSEEDALLFRETHRKIFNHHTEAFHGEIIQYYGDGTLSIFDSAVDAVQCGIAMQRAFQGESRIPVRVGIHSGDIFVSEEDIVGDAVNVASRVESLAVAGSVFISDKVFDEVKNKRGIQTTFLDTYTFKNVKHPMGVYAISNEGLVVPPKSAITGKLEKRNIIGRQLITGLVAVLLITGAIWGYQILQSVRASSPVYQSIAVLPFNNYTGRDDLDYYVDGMHNLLNGDLSKVSALRVISHTTMQAFKNSEKSIAEIAAELNVDAILETSVFCLEEDSFCIKPQLLGVDPVEQQLWGQDYYEGKSEMLNFSRLLVKNIAEEINVTLTPQEEQLMAEVKTVDTTALEHYMKGLIYLDQINPTSLENAFRHFKIAAEIEPEWGAPYAGLANAIGSQMQMGFRPALPAIPEMQAYLDTALELDPNSADAHYQMAITAVWTEWDWEKGEAAFLKSLELDPNNSLCRMFYAHLLTILRRDDEALRQAQIAQELDPRRPFILGLHAIVLLWAAGEYDSALSQVEKALSIEPDHHFAKGRLIQIYEDLGDYEKAFDIWKDYALWGDEVVPLAEEVFLEQGYWAAQEEITKLYDEIEKRGDHVTFFSQAWRCLFVKKYDRAVTYYEKAYDVHGPNLPYISAKFFFDQLKGHPGYIKLLKKMKLPVE